MEAPGHILAAMKSTRPLHTFLGFCLVVGSLAGPAVAQTEPRGSLVLEHIDSTVLRDTRTGLDPRRSVSVYLPPGYEGSGTRYPVVYYFHSFRWDNERMFADGGVQRVLDRGIGRGAIRPFILVAANYSTPTVGSFYENSSTSGRWMDFTVKELVPFVDRTFRTLARRESRGLAGEFIGGYGALRFAMYHPELFSSVYALHPVGAGAGEIPMALNQRPDWPRILNAKSFADLSGDGFSEVFVAMAQAFSPNPNRPPFYCDFAFELVDGAPKYHPEHGQQLWNAFLLDRLVMDKAAALQQMRGIKMDWGRFDPTRAHVESNQALTRTLLDLGVEHEAEEYNGVIWEKNWIEHGRVETDLLPFFARHLAFAPDA